MRLDAGEAFNAAIAGLQRQFRAIERQAKNTVEQSCYDELATHVHGAIAEAAVAKALGLYCNLCSKDRSLPDIYPNIEVRSTLKPDGPLIVRSKDATDRKYYLVAGMYPNIQIVGWLWGKDCKLPEYYQDVKNPYWKVPQYKLNPELIEF